jgi:hypothetical protein
MHVLQYPPQTKPDHHDITEILLNIWFNTHNPVSQSYEYILSLICFVRIDFSEQP